MPFRCPCTSGHITVMSISVKYVSDLTLTLCLQLEGCGLQKTVAKWKQLLDHISCMIYPSVHCMGLSGWLMT